MASIEGVRVAIRNALNNQELPVYNLTYARGNGSSHVIKYVGGCRLGMYFGVAISFVKRELKISADTHLRAEIWLRGKKVYSKNISSELIRGNSPAIIEWRSNLPVGMPKRRFMFHPVQQPDDDDEGRDGETDQDTVSVLFYRMRRAQRTNARGQRQSQDIDDEELRLHKDRLTDVDKQYTLAPGLEPLSQDERRILSEKLHKRKENFRPIDKADEPYYRMDFKMRTDEMLVLIGVSKRIRSWPEERERIQRLQKTREEAARLEAKGESDNSDDDNDDDSELRFVGEIDRNRSQFDGPFRKPGTPASRLFKTSRSNSTVTPKLEEELARNNRERQRLESELRRRSQSRTNSRASSVATTRDYRSGSVVSGVGSEQDPLALGDEAGSQADPFDIDDDAPGDQRDRPLFVQDDEDIEVMLNSIEGNGDEIPSNTNEAEEDELEELEQVFRDQRDASRTASEEGLDADGSSKRGSRKRGRDQLDESIARRLSDGTYNELSGRAGRESHSVMIEDDDSEPEMRLLPTPRKRKKPTPNNRQGK